MRATIRQDPTKPIRRVYNECIVIGSDSEEDLDALPQFSEVRSSLSRHRSNYFPAIPRRVRDVTVRGQWKRTWKGETFLVHQDTHWGILLFMSPICAARLQHCSNIYVDGTFKTCPKPFKQLVTVHGKYGDRVLPLAFAMLRSKETGLYREMLQQIKANVSRISGGDLSPAKVICDFEIALITAIETEFPASSVRGCYFHFCQSLWRKVQELGLSVAYRQHQSVKNLIRKMMSLGYLPLQVVRMTFNLIYSSGTVARLMRRFPSLRDFISYFRLNYIDGNFKPVLWNVYDRNVDCRTNNHVEGYTLHFSK